jgi:formyltetrahydrofolate deformylase
MKGNDNTAVLLISCPDKPGILAAVTEFINQHKGNIVYLDQYVNREEKIFFMRVKWELETFQIPKEKIEEYFGTLIASRYNMVLKVDYLIVSNGLQHYCCRIDYEHNSYTFLQDIPEYQNL